MIKITKRKETDLIRFIVKNSLDIDWIRDHLVDLEG